MKRFSIAGGLAAMLMLALATVAMAAPTNDNFGSSKRVEFDTLAPNGGQMFSTTARTDGATVEVGEPLTTPQAPPTPADPLECGGVVVGATVWYDLRTNTRGNVNLSLYEYPGYDGVVAVYRDPSDGVSGLEFVGCAEGGTKLNFTAQSGTRYVIQVGGIGGDEGRFILTGINKR